jgi:hypothetical protein
VDCHLAHPVRPEPLPLVNEAKQDVLGTDVAVVEQPDLVLRQDLNSPRRFVMMAACIWPLGSGQPKAAPVPADLPVFSWSARRVVL